MTRVSVRDLCVRLGEKPVLRDVSLEVEPGEFLVLVGPSGCGKSTLLRALAGLLPVERGTIHLDERDVTDAEPRERDVAMVFQSYALYPHKTVRGNLSFPLKLARLPRAEIDERVRQAADFLGLADLLERKPAQLSGGQMQRVALGRAMVRAPRLFLFDEPLSNLDAKLREEMRAEILALHRRLGVTTVYVTHDQAEAMTMGSRICVLSEGRVEQVGPPLEVYDRPATAFVAGFIGSPPMNLLEGRVEGDRFVHAGGAMELGEAPPVQGEVRMGVRAQALERGSGVELSVDWIEERGSEVLYQGRLGDRPFRVLWPGRGEVRVGEKLSFKLPSGDSGDLHWFTLEGDRRPPGGPAS